MSKKKDTLTMIDLGGTASGIGLIPRRITLKDNEFDQFIQNISLSKTTMSKDQDLVSLTMSILDKPPRRYKLDTDGFFKEDQEQITGVFFGDMAKGRVFPALFPPRRLPGGRILPAPALAVDRDFCPNFIPCPGPIKES